MRNRLVILCVALLLGGCSGDEPSAAVMYDGAISGADGTGLGDAGMDGGLSLIHI